MISLMDSQRPVLFLQTSAGLGYANVKMMQYDISGLSKTGDKKAGEKQMVDIAEIVRLTSALDAIFMLAEHDVQVHHITQDQVCHTEQGLKL